MGERNALRIMDLTIFSAFGIRIVEAQEFM